MGLDEDRLRQLDIPKAAEDTPARDDFRTRRSSKVQITADVACSRDLLELIFHRLKDEFRKRELGEDDWIVTHVSKCLGAILPQLPSDAQFRSLPFARAEYTAIQKRPDAFSDAVATYFSGVGPLGPLLEDPQVHVIAVNGADSIFYERGGVKRASQGFVSDEHMMRVVNHLLRPASCHVDRDHPIVETRLRDGTMVLVAVPPVSPEGPTITIRKPHKRTSDLKWLTNRRVLNGKLAVFLEACIQARLNIVVVGGAHSGKSAVLSALVNQVAPTERVVLIEGDSQLPVDLENRLYLQATLSAGHEDSRVDARTLVRAATRMKPSRIVLDECVGDETFEFLQALCAGYDGCMTSVHANSAKDMLVALQLKIQMCGVQLNEAAILKVIGRAIHLIVVVEETGTGGFRVQSLTALQKQADGSISFLDVFEYIPGGGPSAPPRYRSSGFKPQFMDRLNQSGVTLPPDLFSE